MQHPLLRRTVSKLARGLDRAFAGAALRPPGRFLRGNRGPEPAAAVRLQALSVIASFYDRPEDELFARPEAIEPERVQARTLSTRGQVIDLHWPSLFEPLWSRAALAEHVTAREALRSVDLAAIGFDRSADLREKYLRSRANRTAHARWFKHDGPPRPCVVLVHGYMAGNYVIEERVWQVKRLYESGLDVVMTVLPLHGPRRSEERGYRPPAFPSNDARFTIEGFRQLVFDHRALFGFLRAQGVPSLGIMGMSLGGYSAALLATLESYLRFAVMLVPLASIEDFVRENGRFAGSPTEQQALHEALRLAHRPISPFARPSLLAPERVVVVAGESDLVTGVGQARVLAAHFDAELSLFHGGHLLHAGRELAFTPVWRLLCSFAASDLG
jgi:pimeloyl-ACP methyl ester carboxylesterase